MWTGLCRAKRHPPLENLCCISQTRLSPGNDSSTNTLRQRLKDKVQAHREVRASNASPQKGDAAGLERLTKPGTYNFTLRHGGLQRAYLVHVPRGYDAAVPTQVVVAFHGGGGDMNL